MRKTDSGACLVVWLQICAGFASGEAPGVAQAPQHKAQLQIIKSTEWITPWAAAAAGVPVLPGMAAPGALRPLQAPLLHHQCNICPQWPLLPQQLKHHVSSVAGPVTTQHTRLINLARPEKCTQLVREHPGGERLASPSKARHGIDFEQHPDQARLCIAQAALSVGAAPAHTMQPRT